MENLTIDYSPECDELYVSMNTSDLISLNALYHFCRDLFPKPLFSVVRNVPHKLIAISHDR